MKLKLNINVRLPESWNALSEKQLSEIAHCLEYYRSCQAEELEAQNAPDKKLELTGKLCVHLAKNLLRGNNFLKVWYALKQIPPENYLPYLQFMLKENNRTVFPKAFKGNDPRGQKLHPPSDRLQNLKMEEFSFADSLYYNWRKTSDDRYLDLLCATLYREGFGIDETDNRKPFNRFLVEKNVPEFQNFNKKKKLAIAYAYEGSRNHIVKQYPTVFPPPPKEEPENPEPETRNPKYTPFGQLIHHKIQFDTGKLSETENLNIHKFLSIYENELREMKKQQQFNR